MSTTPTTETTAASRAPARPDDEVDEGAGERHRAEPEAARPPWWRPVLRFEHGGRRFLPGVWFPLVTFAVWRVLHAVATLAFLADDHPDESMGQLWTRLVEAPLAYDGERYMAILTDGYQGWRFQMPNTAFFPMLSWLGRPVHAVTGSEVWTANLMAAITGVAAFVTVWGVSRAWKDERIARRAVLLLALLPSSLFLWAFYSEGLFIALSAGAVWADRRGRHGLAAALFVPLAATRSVGILVPAVLVVLRIVRTRRIDRWSFAYAVAGAAGMALVLWTMWDWTGDPFVWTTVQEDWGRELAPPWSSVLQGIDNLYPDPDTIMVPALVARNWDLWCVGIAAVGLGYAGASRKDPWPGETWLLGLVLVLVPLSSSVLASFNRFLMADWVLYPVYASLLGRLPRWLRWVLVPAIIVSLVAVTLLLLERFVADPPRFVG